MKKPLLFVFTFLSAGLYAQEHFSGITTSRRTGIINSTINPAELTNLKNDYEVNIFTLSANLSNNKVTFGDLVGGDEDFEEMLFSGSDPVNMRIDAEILGPSFAFKMDKWAFAITSAAKVRANLVDIDTELGSALTIDPIMGSVVTANINSTFNQRATATSWGEIGLSAARDIFNNEEHKISAGISLKLIFPGTYANVSADRFNGEIVTDLLNDDVYLTDASANLNLAYSGSLAEGFDDPGNFANFFAGGLNGLSTDIGFNYQWKDSNNPDNGYRLNAGLALRNLGSMTFKDDNNENKSYNLNIEEGELLNLSQFEDADGFDEVEEIFAANPQFFQIRNASKDFKVKTPALISAYADYNVYGRWYATAYFQQKLNEDGKNEQIAVQNMISLTPRYSTGFFEAYVPLAHNEIAGFTAGIGFRVGGFYIGSGSILSAAISDTNQADAYLGFRFGF